jgi:hypothetical protein
VEKATVVSQHEVPNALLPLTVPMESDRVTVLEAVATTPAEILAWALAV